MASLRTPAPLSDGGQGIIKILKVASAVTGDTVYYNGPMRGWWSCNKTTADALNVTWTAASNLFTIVVANTPDVDIFILQ
jgi:hypothetical protein